MKKKFLKYGLLENEQFQTWISVILMIGVAVGIVVSLLFLQGCSDPSKEVRPDVKIEKPERGITIDTSKSGDC